MPMIFDGRPGEEQKMAAVAAEWKIAYPKRRKAFLDRFEKIMTDAGQTWKSLGIEFIRDDAAWPN